MIVHCWYTWALLGYTFWLAVHIAPANPDRGLLTSNYVRPYILQYIYNVCWITVHVGMENNSTFAALPIS